MEAIHYAAILRGVAVNVMYQGFRSIHKLPINNLMISQYGGHFQYLTIQGCEYYMLGMYTSSNMNFIQAGLSLYLHGFRDGTQCLAKSCL